MFGFGKKQTKNYLGIDIGAGGIKIVELMNEKGRGRLITYGYSERSSADVLHPLEDPKGTSEMITSIFKQSGMTSVRAIGALPLSSVFSAIVAVPRGKDEKEIKAAVNEQVKKLTPMPLEDMITYSTFIDPIKIEKPIAPVAPVLPNQPKKQEYVRVLVTGAAKSLVQKYIEIFKLSKIELVALDTEAFALIRALVGKDKSTVMIVDMGYVRTNLMVVEKGVPFLTRSINVGGGTVTKKIMELLHVSEAEAERFKQDLGNVSEAGAAPPNGLSNVLGSILQPMLNEIKFAAESYSKMELTDGKKIEKIILTGGSAHLPSLIEELTKAMNVNVYVGDPWARVVAPDELRPALEEIGPKLAVAIGLAMREID
ncbi:MAG: pilus assembly protein PilM [Patescibacteria group bacterium]|jgi:type IV pilus assembly protein PilM